MKNKFKNKTERKQHSFYKEANNSILGSQKFTPAKVRKQVFKLTKWATFLFLIIVTIWGCVNEIILKTSHDLGQGMEFYQKDEFIYPNMYATQDIVGYTAAKHAVTEGVNNNKETSGTETQLKKQTNNFNFTTINPFFQININKDETTKNLSAPDKKKLTNIIDKFSVSSDEFYKINNNKLESGMFFARNLNEMTAEMSGIFSYFSKTLNEKGDKGSSVGPWAPKTLDLPTRLKKEAGEELKKVKKWKDKHKYSVSSWTDFLYFLADKADKNLDGEADLNNEKLNAKDEEGAPINTINGPDWKHFFNLIENQKGNTFKRSEVIGTNGTFIPSKISNISEAMDLKNWTPIFSIKEKIKDKEKNPSIDNIPAQAQITLNKDAFLNGTLKSDGNDFFSKKVNNGKKTLQKVYEEEAKKAKQYKNLKLDGKVDYSSIKNGIENVYAGAEMAIIPIKKGFPIRPSKTAIDLIQGINGEGGFRTKGFQKRPLTDNSNQGFDPSIQNFGWVLIDNNGDIRSVHKKGEKPSLENTIENNALYGDQRRMGWGVVGYDTPNLDPLDNKNSVFDEKVKQIMNRGLSSKNKEDQYKDFRYVTENKTINIGQESIKYNYETTFAGLMATNQSTNISDEYKGVLPSYDKKSDGKVWESSLLSDSALSAGQDSWAKGRVTFIGWADWGKAWDTRYGPLYGGFVFPIAQMAMSIGDMFGYKNHPWGTLASILLIVFLVRALGTLLSAKGTKNQLKMQEVQTDVAKIKARYARYDLKKDKKMKQKQQAEIMALYKKNEVNPAGSLGTIFITMPIFISLWIIIAALPAYKIASMGAFSFAVSAWYGIFHLGTMFILYLMVGLSVGLVQGVSSKLPTWLANKRKGVKRVDEATKKAMKKQNRTQNIMVIVFIIIGLTVPALFAFYWIASGLFTIFLEFGRHAYRTQKAKKVKEGKTKIKITQSSKNA